MYDLPGGRGHLVEITCPRWLRSQVDGLLVHESTQLDRRDVQLIDDIPVMRPERVALELASIYRSPDYVERILHAARRKRLITHSSTKEMLDRLARRGRPGVVVFRAALDRWPLRATESEMETTLLHVLRRAGLPEPFLQHEVYDDTGLFVARVDAAYPQWRVLIEYDSKQEHSDEWAIARGASRRNRLVELGYSTLVARHHDLREGGRDLCRAIRNLRHSSAYIAPR